MAYETRPLIEDGDMVVIPNALPNGYRIVGPDEPTLSDVMKRLDELQAHVDTRCKGIRGMILGMRKGS